MSSIFAEKQKMPTATGSSILPESEKEEFEEGGQVTGIGRNLLVVMASFLHLSANHVRHVC